MGARKGPLLPGRRLFYEVDKDAVAGAVSYLLCVEVLPVLSTGARGGVQPEAVLVWLSRASISNFAYLS